MKKILLILTLTLSGLSFADERPFQSFFGIKTTQPLAVVAAMVFLTEINSNTATTAVFLPVLAGRSKRRSPCLGRYLINR